MKNLKEKLQKIVNKKGLKYKRKSRRKRIIEFYKKIIQEITINAKLGNINTIIFVGDLYENLYIGEAAIRLLKMKTNLNIELNKVQYHMYSEAVEYKKYIISWEA